MRGKKAISWGILALFTASLLSLVFPSSSGLLVEIPDPPVGQYVKGDLINFHLNISTQGDESIPFNCLSVVLGGPVNAIKQFGLNGNNISGPNWISITPLTLTYTEGYGYMHGYDYRYWYGYGYGYDFNFGYGYGTTFSASYSITIDSNYLTAGNYSLYGRVETGNVIHYYYPSNVTYFQVMAGTTPQAPIRINSNADFDAVHGVTGGNGTQGNPWIIENWDINGSGYGYGIYIGNTTDYFVVRNNYLHEASGIGSWPYYSDSGLILYRVQNGSIVNNTASPNNTYGIVFVSSSGNIIANNIASYNSRGIHLATSNSNIVSNNIASYNTRGITLASSRSNIITDNTMVEDGIFILGLSLQHWNTHTIDTSNTVNGKSVYYWKNQTGGIVPGSAGQVILANCTNVVVENQSVSNGSSGIELGFSFNNTLANNYASNNIEGICLYSSDRNTIANNIASKNSVGIFIYSSNSNSIANNTISLNGDGIYLDGSSNTTIVNNTALNNTYFIYFYSSSNNTVVNNTASNNQYGIYLSSSTSNTITNNIASSNNWFGICLDFSSSNTITNNIALSNTYYGIYLYSSSSNNIANNTASNNYDGGIILYTSSNYNTITNNNASLNTYKGVSLDSSSGNNITDNTASNNGQYGIYLVFSDRSTIFNNTASNNEYGIYLVLFSNSNTIFNNTASSNTNYGIYLTALSSNNTIYYNNFINNTNQAYDDRNDNWWNTSYPTGGNYWSDYTGTDTMSGPLQNIPGADGIGDTPFIIDADSQDNYPLMTPWNGSSSPTTPFFKIPVVAGWNLISIPLIPTSTSVPDALTDSDGDTAWDRIQWFDAFATSNIWKQYYSGWNYTLNDLSGADNQKGLWINITAVGDGFLNVSGSISNSTSVPLHAGWNMVGYPTLNNTTTVGDAFWGTGATMVETFDPAAPYRTKFVGPSYVMKPGEGYWVYVPADTIWTVNW
ncbi:MAG: right-handed parallel beta-helix repeat-containing protein [Euryarchaeota archaeon]|nr:right-handed parallel beta-helix repeat-containing protein [Euryarchaeota archaeon]